MTTTLRVNAQELRVSASERSLYGRVIRCVIHRFFHTIFCVIPSSIGIAPTLFITLTTPCEMCHRHSTHRPCSCEFTCLLCWYTVLRCFLLGTNIAVLLDCARSRLVLPLLLTYYLLTTKKLTRARRNLRGSRGLQEVLASIAARDRRAKASQVLSFSSRIAW